MHYFNRCDFSKLKETQEKKQPRVNTINPAVKVKTCFSSNKLFIVIWSPEDVIGMKKNNDVRANKMPIVLIFDFIEKTTARDRTIKHTDKII